MAKKIRVRIPSTLANRFELIEQEQAHLECGSNTIVSDRQEVAFSDPFFSSGTRFLVKNSNTSTLDLDSSLNKVKLGVLDVLIGKLNKQGLEPQNYQTVPEQPLTCDYYGLILPINDAQWRETVNTFIRDRNSKQVLNQWFESYYDRAIADLDYCQNRRE